MSLIKTRAKINNIRNRVLPYGKKDRLQLVDRNSREVIADVKLWSWKELNSLQQDAPEFRFQVAATSETEDVLATCLLAFNGILHDVPVRNAPSSVNGIEWVFLTKPTNERVS